MRRQLAMEGRLATTVEWLKFGCLMMLLGFPYVNIRYIQLVPGTRLFVTLLGSPKHRFPKLRDNKSFVSASRGSRH